MTISPVTTIMTIFISPFGEAIAFTQSTAAKKRVIEYNLSKRRMARALKQ